MEIVELAGVKTILSFNNFLNEQLIISDSPLFAGRETTQAVSSFSPPAVALHNVLHTPQLEATEIVSSRDYDENSTRAHSGYSPVGIINNNFKIDGD